MSYDGSSNERESTSDMSIMATLGADNWNSRRDAVTVLRSTVDPATIEQLLGILREQHRDFSRLNAAIQVLALTSAEVTSDLVGLLSNPDAEVRTYSALTLGERGDPDAIRPLIQALHDPDANVRVHVIEALGKLRAAEAVDTLVDFVTQMDFELTSPSIDALIAIGDRRAVGALTPLLFDSFYNLSAVEAVGALGCEEHVKPLMDLLVDPEVPTACVCDALVRIQERHREEYGNDWIIPQTVRRVATLGNVQKLILSLDASTTPSQSPGPAGLLIILSWLAGEGVDEAITQAVLRLPFGTELLPVLKNRGAGLISRLLDHPATLTPELRSAVISTAAHLGDRTFVPVLVQWLLNEADGELLRQVLEALAAIGDPSAYDAVSALLGHENPRVRQAAVAAVNSLGHPNTLSDLASAFDSDSPLLRESAVKIAAYLGMPECIDQVLAACRDGNERVRREAVTHLPYLDDPRAIECLETALRSDSPSVRVAAVSAVAQFEDQERACRLLATALSDPEVWVRYFGVRSVVATKRQSDFVRPLIDLAQSDAAMQVRVAAVEALADCGQSAAAVLLDLSASNADDLSFAAIQSLGVIGHPDAETALLAALGSKDREKRRRAILAFGRAKRPSAVQIMAEVALERDEEFWSVAVDSLAQLRFEDAAEALVQIARFPAKRDLCVLALAEMGETAIPVLARNLRNGELETRRICLDALARIRTPAAREILEIGTMDSAPTIRLAALSALTHIQQT